MFTQLLQLLVIFTLPPLIIIVYFPGYLLWIVIIDEWCMNDHPDVHQAGYHGPNHPPGFILAAFWPIYWAGYQLYKLLWPPPEL